MIYLLEGPDGAGKSFLAKHLSDNGFKQIELVPKRWPAQYEIYRDLFTELEMNESKHCVMDRCFISELVYRIVKNDRPANITLSDIVELLENFPITVIYCNTKTAFEDSMKRGDKYITDSDEHKQISIAYDIVMSIIDKFTNTEIIKYDWQKDNLGKLIMELKRK